MQGKDFSPYLYMLMELQPNLFFCPVVVASNPHLIACYNFIDKWTMALPIKYLTYEMQKR